MPEQALPSKQITYPAAQFQVIKVEAGKVFIMHTAFETMVVPISAQQCEDLARELTSRIDVIPASALVMP